MSPEFDDDHTEAICRAQIEHGLEFVVIGADDNHDPRATADHDGGDL